MLYLRDELLPRVQFSNDVLLYTTLFRPKYAATMPPDATHIDFSHEREWRTPGPVQFDYEDIAFVCIPSWEALQNKLPDIYNFCTTNCIKFKVVARSPRWCRFSYDCNRVCKQEHTNDEKAYFLRISMKRLKGTIKRIGPKDFGFIKPDDGEDIHFFRSELSNSEFAWVGSSVIFSPSENATGPTAVDIEVI